MLQIGKAVVTQLHAEQRTLRGRGSTVKTKVKVILFRIPPLPLLRFIVDVFVKWMCR